MPFGEVTETPDWVEQSRNTLELSFGQGHVTMVKNGDGRESSWGETAWNDPF